MSPSRLIGAADRAAYPWPESTLCAETGRSFATTTYMLAHWSAKGQGEKEKTCVLPHLRPPPLPLPDLTRALALPSEAIGPLEGRFLPGYCTSANKEPHARAAPIQIVYRHFIFDHNRETARQYLAPRFGLCTT